MSRLLPDLPEDEILKIIERQNIHLARISKNVQFFFWFFIVSIFLTIGISILGAASF